jgi:hypothetical protein
MSLLKFLRLNKSSTRYLFIRGVIDTEQISVLEIIKYLLSFWKVIVVLAIIYGLLGYIKAKSSPIFYTSETVIIPDGGAPPKASVGGLEDLLQAVPAAAAAGSVGITSFPGIAESTPFLRRMLNDSIFSEQHQAYLKLGDYLEELNPKPNIIDRVKAPISSLQNKFWALFESKEEPAVVSNQKRIVVDTLERLSLYELSLMGNLTGRIKIDGLASITISTDLPDAQMSTRLNNLVLKNLVSEITKIKTAKQRRDLSYLQKKLDTAKVNFDASQLAVAKFNDENRGATTSLFSVTLSKLNADYNLFLTIYSNLAAEMESTKIDLLINTPFYSVFEPAYVPEIPSGGFSVSLVIRNILIGIVLGVLWGIIYTSYVIFTLLTSKLKSIELSAGNEEE